MSRHRRDWRSAGLGMLSGLLVVLGGCNGDPVRVPARPAPPPPPTYRGPAFLHGTIGSVASLRGYLPVLVSGYGLVAGLDDTGSIDCPPALRGWLLNEMAKRGFGRESLGFGQLTPEQVLASRSTAVVLVQGIIPPGAPADQRIDILVTALPQTQTTSLEGGVLYTTDLRVEGANVNRPSFGAIARARGPIFLDPAARPDTADPAILDPTLR
ncbi:MAG: flagellar basal body P-ring protein FlgI, partial [Phycisphaerae bacterium]|nr:flagellar basal body P-ring protein FlgI [Phycisphaerae bacterium]